MRIKTILLDRVENVISYAEKALVAAVDGSGGYSELQTRMRTQGLSLINDLNGTSHPNYSEFELRSRQIDSGSTRRSKSILEGIKNEIENDYYLSTIRSLVSADIFADFLEMAQHLLDERYKDPAAVLIGSTLEEHLRQLCINHVIDITLVNGKGDTVPKKADVMNADLVKARVYNALQGKAVTAWLGLRNSAAHGKYSDYTEPQVRELYQGVLTFMANTK